MEMQINTTMSYDHVTTRMAKVKKTNKAKCWQECRTIRILIGSRSINILGNWQYLLKLIISIPYEPGIPFLSIYRIGMYTYVSQKTGTRIFTTAYFKTDPNYKQSKCPSITE